jgi:amino acid permease
MNSIIKTKLVLISIQFILVIIQMYCLFKPSRTDEEQFISAFMAIPVCILMLIVLILPKGRGQ